MSTPAVSSSTRKVIESVASRQGACEAFALISNVLRCVAVQFPYPALKFRFALRGGILRRVAAIERAWRTYMWRRNAFLEHHLRVWLRHQGAISTADLGHRWKKNMEFVKHVLATGSQVPRSKTAVGFMQELSKAMQRKNLDTNIMMEVLVQRFTEARVYYITRMLRDRVSSTASDGRPLLPLMQALRPPDPSAESTLIAASNGSPPFLFELDECYARYAALKHHYDDIKKCRYSAELAARAQGKTAMISFKAFDAAAEEPPSVPDRGASSCDVTPQEVQLQDGDERVNYNFVSSRNTHDDAAASFFVSASRRARRLISFRDDAAAAANHIDYDKLPSAGPARDEKMMWTNDLTKYILVRLARDEAREREIRRTSLALRQSDARSPRRGSIEPNQASRRASRRASAVRAASTTAVDTLELDDLLKEAEPATGSEHTQKHRSSLSNEASRRASRRVSAVRAASRQLIDPPDDEKEASAERVRDTTATLSLPILCSDCPRGSSPESRSMAKSGLRPAAVGNDSLLAKLSNREKRQLAARRNAEMQRRHRLARQSLTESLSRIRDLSNDEGEQQQQKRSVVRLRHRPLILTKAPSSPPDKSASTERLKPQPQRVTRHESPVRARPSSLMPDPTLEKRVGTTDLSIHSIRTHEGHSPAGVALSPRGRLSALVYRVVPWQMQAERRGLHSRKSRAGYDDPTKVARHLQNTRGQEDTPSPSPELEQLCRRVAKGNATLELALRREWATFVSTTAQGGK